MGKLQLIQTVKKHTGRVWNVSWHPKGDLFASCGEDKTIRLWSKDLLGKWGTKVVLVDGHKRTIRQISWSPCGNLLASASFDATTCIWTKQSGEYECNATLEGHENEVKSVAWSKSGHFLATCSRDKSVWIWEVAEENEFDCAAILNAHSQDVKRIVWHPNKDLLASASYDNTIKLFREDVGADDWICCATLIGHESTVWSLSFDATGQRLASCSDDNTVKIWKEYLPGNSEGVITVDNDPTWKCVCTISGQHSRTIYDIDWSPISGLLATACADNGLRIFQQDESSSDENSPTFNLVCNTEKAHCEDVNSLQWNPVIKGLLISCSDDGEIKIWNYVETD